MRFAALVVGAALAAPTLTPASATVRIKSDPGGQIGPYLEALYELRSSGEKVVIDGPCLSACTMVLGVIPRERLCVTPRAQFGFHAAWHPGRNGPVTSQSATKLLMDVYPEDVKSWIKARGGLTRKLMVLSGPELTAMYPACPTTTVAQSKDSRRKPGTTAAVPLPVPAPARAATASTPPPAAVSAMAE
jgi:hypothetical protein